MSDPADNLVLEQLRIMRSEARTTADRLNSRLASIDVQPGALGQQLAALTAADYRGQVKSAELERRIERIERRLELIGDAE